VSLTLGQGTPLHMHMDIPEIGFIWAKGLYLFVGQPAAKTNQNKVELLKKKVGKTTKYLKAIAGGGAKQKNQQKRNFTSN